MNIMVGGDGRGIHDGAIPLSEFVARLKKYLGGYHRRSSLNDCP